MQIERSSSRFATIAGWCIAVAAVAWGIYAMWRYGWRDLYADQWRLYRQFVELGFPANVLFLENGHRPVIPNLVRVVELEWFHGSQSLQLWVGIILAATTVLALWRVAWRDAGLDPLQRALASAAIALAVFWLANARMLMHPNEAVHAYLITAMLALAISRIAAYSVREASLRSALAACAIAGFVATFSFGPGVVVFVACAIGLLHAGAPWRAHVALAAALGATLLVYFLLPGGEAVGGVLSFSPLRNARVAFQWLANPAVLPLLPFADPNLATWAPIGEDLARASATAYRARFGNPWTAVFPQVLVGAAGVALLVWRSGMLLRDRALPTRTELAGIVLGWFGVGVAAVVSLSRLEYFEQYPDQVYANRYLPWGCLFWLGVLLAHLRLVRRAPAISATSGLVAAAWLLGMNPVWASWSKDVQTHLRREALAMNLDRWAPVGRSETQPAEVHAAIEALRKARVAQFAWPSARWLGRRVDSPLAARAESAVLAAAPPEGETPVLALHLPDAMRDAPARHWLVVDSEGRVIGLATRVPLWSGVRLEAVLARDASAYEAHAIHPVYRHGVGNGILLERQGEVLAGPVEPEG